LGGTTDLGAIVSDNQGHDLSYKTFLDGALVSNIIIATIRIEGEESWPVMNKPPAQDGAMS
jgi:hypothetical protein